MQEYLDKESDDVKSAVEQYKDSYNKQLKHEENITLDWSALDSATASTTEPIESTNQLVESSSNSEATTLETTESKTQSNNAIDSKRDERTEQLLARQR